MVVRWSAVAEVRLKGIFDYYLDAAGDKVAMKIAVEIRNAVDSLGTMPLMAPVENDLTDREVVFRSLVINRRYKVIYFVEDESVIVVDIWDCHQNPVMLKKRVAKQP